MRFFHAAHARYFTGHVIEPGNWGRVIEETGIRHNQFWREALFEQVRQDVAPNAACRMRSVFGVVNEHWARVYRDTEVSQGFLYEVETTRSIFRHHNADLRVFDLLADVSTIAGARDLVAAYWRGESVGGYPEILVETSVRVVRQLRS